MTARESSRDRLAFLDAIRGVAALLVVVEHGLEQCVPGYLEWSLRTVNLGKLGVLMFLLVSGFIIPLSLERGGSNARFWMRRFFRLFPAYWLSIALAYGYLCAGGAVPLAVGLGDSSSWLVNLTMLQGFFKCPHVWGVFWTLQLELVIYLACSLLFRFGLLRRALLLAALAISAYAVLGIAKPVLTGKLHVIVGQRFLYFAPLVGFIAQRYAAGRLPRAAAYGVPIALAAAVVACWTCSVLLFPGQATAECLRYFACTWGISLAAFFLLLEARGRAMPGAATWLGRVSYSVYLLHPFVLTLLLAALPCLVLLPILLAGTLLLSEAAFRCVEAPGIALGRRVETKLFPRRADTSPVPARKAA